MKKHETHSEEKKQYVKPELSSYGRISTLTTGGTMGGPEGMAMSPDRVPMP